MFSVAIDLIAAGALATTAVEVFRDRYDPDPDLGVMLSIGAALWFTMATVDAGVWA